MSQDLDIRSNPVTVNLEDLGRIVFWLEKTIRQSMSFNHFFFFFFF